jgi:repressor LexA
MSGSRGATPTQSITLAHIRQFVSQNGYSPSVAELASMAGVRPNAVADRLKALLRKGLITHRPGAMRSILPVEAGPALVTPDPRYLDQVTDTLRAWRAAQPPGDLQRHYDAAIDWLEVLSGQLNQVESDIAR